ncbi:MAG: SusC/RagA family TonB-linked outer membrane protein [Bacteroidetes bacterium]|nr:SusC/RagA family TonB-linked outer membrane protein [Bacteroidota bacterium]
MRAILLGAVFSFMALTAFGQRTITGTVVSEEDNEPLIGATIQIKGGATGTVTDLDGAFSVQANTNDTLVFSYVGFIPQEVPVGAKNTIDVVLRPDAFNMEEVVVVGYGTQRERDLISAVSTLESDDIIKTPTPQAMQSLQGKVAGVQIVSNGAPGGAPTVRIRGVGSFEGAGAPLYVVDGMFVDDISFLNPSDIESLSVLKDASSAAIYGVRAGNGVVLITTKSGSFNQPAQVTYDGYYGIQNPQNVIQMSNAQQFVQYIEETGSAADQGFIDNAMQRFGRSTVDPNVPAVNTDWYDLIMSPAPMQSHNVSVSGGTSQIKYTVGLGFIDQQGLLNETRNEFQRFNIRTRIDAILNDWLTVGGNINGSNARRFDGSNAAWFNAYHSVPILPKTDPLNTDASEPQLANAQLLGYRGLQNPFYSLVYNDNRNNAINVVGNLYAQAQIIPEKLSFKTQYNYSFENANNRSVSFAFNDGVTDRVSGLSRNHLTRFDQVWDNFLTYTDNFGKHNVKVTAGQSYRSEYAQGLFARGTELDPNPTRDNEELWYLDRAVNFEQDAIGDFGSNLFFMSYFGRLSYNFDDRYLLYATYRVDGNNKFQTKWNNFATVGGGWIVSGEPFFNIPAVSFLKLRGSWGELGNDAINPAVGTPTLNPGRLTVFNGAPVTGRVFDPTFDLIDRPETTVETNFGVDARFFNDRLSVTADYFIRDTRNLAILVEQPLIRGAVRRSLGEIRNEGFEFSANWTGGLGEFRYNIGGNFATLNNEVLSLGGADFQQLGGEFIRRSTVGGSYLAFFGYEINGVFQSREDIESSGYTEEFLENANLDPGDFFFKDQNGDGEINDEDRVALGSFLPDLTFGANLGFSWKNFDFSMLLQGQIGHKILNRKRGEIIFTNDTNIDAELFNNLWRGNGTSNQYPSAAGLRKGWNQNSSEYYIEDGDFWRIQNVQIGYSFENTRLLSAQIPTIRVYATAERPLTVFDYNGFNPEVPDGVDRQVYPVAAVYTLGLNVKF